MGKTDRKGIEGSVIMKAEEEEAEVRLEIHTEQMVTEAGQWCQQHAFLRLPQPVSSLEVQLSPGTHLGQQQPGRGEHR